MHTEDPIVDQRTQIQTVEHIHTLLPHVHRTVLPHALIVKTVHLGYLTTLVVSSQQGHTVRITHLQGQQKQKCFNTVISSIHIITHKQIIRVRTITTDGKQLAEIIELPMNVATNLQTFIHQIQIQLAECEPHEYYLLAIRSLWLYYTTLQLLSHL